MTLYSVQNQSAFKAPPPPPLIRTRKKTIPFHELLGCEDVSHEIGKGVTGSVFKATWRGQPVAVKKYSLPSLPEYLEYEFDPHCLANHPNIVQFIGVCTDPKKFRVVTELCSLNVWAFEQKYAVGAVLTFLLKNRLVSGVAKGLVYLHGNLNVAHGHIKVSNVFFTSNFEGKLANFGLHKLKLEASSAITGNRGAVRHRDPLSFTREYARLTGPQYVNSRKYADIFSFGSLLWRLEARMDLYKGLTEAEVVISLGRRELPKINYGWEYALIIKACWNADPELRPTAVELLEDLHKLDEKKILLVEFMKEINQSRRGFADAFCHVLDLLNQLTTQDQHPFEEVVDDFERLVNTKKWQEAVQLALKHASFEKKDLISKASLEALTVKRMSSDPAISSRARKELLRMNALEFNKVLVKLGDQLILSNSIDEALKIEALLVSRRKLFHVDNKAAYEPSNLEAFFNGELVPSYLPFESKIHEFRLNLYERLLERDEEDDLAKAEGIAFRNLSHSEELQPSNY